MSEPRLVVDEGSATWADSNSLSTMSSVLSSSSQSPLSNVSSTENEPEDDVMMGRVNGTAHHLKASSRPIIAIKRKASPMGSSSSASIIKLTSKVNGAPTKPEKKKEALNTADAGATPGMSFCHQDGKLYDTMSTTFLHCRSGKSGSTSKSKPCALSYCESCLLHRYGEMAKEIIAQGKVSQWSCPSCRRVCDCKVCQRKRAAAKKRRDAKLTSNGINITPSSKVSKPIAATPQKLGAVRLKAVGGTSTKNKNRPSSSLEPPPAKKKKLSKDKASVIASDVTKPVKSKKVVQESKGGVKNTKKIIKPIKKEKHDTKVIVLNKPKVIRSGSESSLSSLSSIGEHTPVVPEPLPKPKRKRPAPKGPRAVPPPSYAPMTQSEILPPSSSILARLHVREFVLRFIKLMPCLESNSKGRQVIQGMEDIIWFWSRDAEIGQRLLLQGLLELADGEEEEILQEEAARILLFRARKEVNAAAFSSSSEINAKPWMTLVECFKIEGKEGWARDEVDLWVAERLKEEEGKKTRSGKFDVGSDERLAVLCSLIELVYLAKGVRTSMIDGYEVERAARLELTKLKFKAKNDLTEQVALLNGEKPEKPTPSPTKKGAKAAEVKIEAWNVEVAKIDEEIKNAMRQSSLIQQEIQRKLYLASTTYRLRFVPAGVDTLANSYYLLTTTPDTLHPISITADEEFPLGWAVIVHGTPFPLPVKKKKPASPSKGSLAAIADLQATANSASLLDSERSQAGDEWFIVTDPVEMLKLADYIEYEVKKIEHAVKMVEYEQKMREQGHLTLTNTFIASGADKSGVGPTGGLAEDKLLKDTTELVAILRCFGDYAAWEKEQAIEEGKSRKASRPAV